MTKYIYSIFETSEKNNCKDLTMAMAMLMADAKTGVQEYGPDGLDYAALSGDYRKLSSAQKNVLQFISRHYDVLVAAYQGKDQDAFQAVVAACAAQDADREASVR